MPNASVQYLAAGETKTETFTVHAADGTAHNVVVVVTGVNDAPVPGDATDPSWNPTDGRYEISTPEDTPKTGTIAAGDPQQRHPELHRADRPGPRQHHPGPRHRRLGLHPCTRLRRR